MKRPVRPVWLNTVVAKFIELETETPYDTAPAMVFQLRVDEIDWYVAPLGGEDSIGGLGGAMIVVKLQALDHAPMPPKFTPFARQ